MTIRSALCCAVLLTFATSTWGAPQRASVKTQKASKPASASAAKPRKAHPTSLKAAPLPRGKTEILTCRDGTEDRHARIALVLVGGKADSFAYYSKWKPRTCSIYLQRNRDPYSQWSDKGNVTNVNLERGLMLIEHKKGEYRFVFQDIDRERYCGMDGTLNGTLTLRKGRERCELAGLMDEGVPLGQANAIPDPKSPTAAAPAAGPAAAAAEAAPPPQVAQRSGRRPQPTFPNAASGISD